jgi:hypothetical protein
MLAEEKGSEWISAKIYSDPFSQNPVSDGVTTGTNAYSAGDGRVRMNVADALKTTI